MANLKTAHNHRKCNTTLFSGSNMPVTVTWVLDIRPYPSSWYSCCCKRHRFFRTRPKSPSWVYQLRPTWTIVGFGRTKTHHAQTTLEPLYRFLKNCKPLKSFCTRMRTNLFNANLVTVTYLLPRTPYKVLSS